MTNDPLYCRFLDRHVSARINVGRVEVNLRFGGTTEPAVAPADFYLTLIDTLGPVQEVREYGVPSDLWLASRVGCHV